MLQAIIFDFDGTLFPTSLRQEKWFRTYAKSHDVNWPFQNFADFMLFYNSQCAKQGGVQNVYDVLKLPCNMNDRTHPVWPAYELFNQENPLRPYEGIVDVVKTIWEESAVPANNSRSRRIRLGINTTNSLRSIHSDLRRSGILPYFDTIVCEDFLSEYHGNGNAEALKKPSKVSIAMMLGLLDCDGAQTLHIGDTRNDLIASNKVIRINPSRPENLITVGACYGYEGRTILEQGAFIDGRDVKFNYLVDKPEEIVGIVRQLKDDL